MATSNVCKSQRLHIVLIIFMKCSNGFNPHCIDLNWSRIYFWQCFDLYIITPHSISWLSLCILSHIFDHKILKKLLFLQYIFHAKLPNLIVKSFLSIKLIWYCPEQTISISANLFYGQIVFLKLSDHFQKFFLENFFNKHKSYLLQVMTIVFTCQFFSFSCPFHMLCFSIQ